MEFQILSEEQKAKLEKCNGPEDFLALAKEEGYELSDEDLAALSGGGAWDPSDPVYTCPCCHQKFENPNHYVQLPCPHCGAMLGPG